ncbi:MAG: helix-turn-helix domain-containing protein [Thermoplasmata archaeon]|nr:helix-turn-helix domain-containing protein [Thermoplasmata archaeon]
MARNGGGLVELLVAHGLAEPAARIYLVASREGPLPASELARATAVHRVHAYRYINELVERGLLEPTGQRPKRFAPLPVDELLDKWIREEATRLEALRDGRERLLAEWRATVGTPEPHDARRFSIIEGQEAIWRLLKRRFGAARSEILIAVSAFSLPRAVDGGLDRALAHARARGVRVRIVTEVGPSNRTEVKLFSHVAELRHARRPVSNRAILIDRKSAAVFVTGAEGLGGSEAAQLMLWTTDPRFLALTRAYHQRLWSLSVPVDEREVELEQPARAVLPIRRGQSSETFARLQEIAELGMTATGIEELRVDLPELIETVARQLGRQIAEGMEGTSPEEVVQELAAYYRTHSLGKVEVVRSAPLTLTVRNCFACRHSPEIGRVLCPEIIGTVLETRLGERFDISKPDPTRHAERGCVFGVRAA